MSRDHEPDGLTPSSDPGGVHADNCGEHALDLASAFHQLCRNLCTGTPFPQACPLRQCVDRDGICPASHEQCPNSPAIPPAKAARVVPETTTAPKGRK